MHKPANIFFGSIAILLLVSGLVFFGAKVPRAKTITWGVNFSQMQAASLGLDWKENYLALLQDLGVKNIKLITNWDFVEGKKDNFYFNDIDWQLAQAKKYDAKVIYVVGMKTGRWPECHVPGWAGSISEQEQQDEILNYIAKVVQRYKNSSVITAWQAENEPLFNFGKCPWYDKDFLKKEVALIKTLDPTRPVIVSDSGEQSLWFGAAKIGDIVGSTMYRKFWVGTYFGHEVYFSFPYPPQFYYYKAQLVKYLFNKTVICVELQAEPWVSDIFTKIPLNEQQKTMNPVQFEKNVEYAKQTGLDTFYLWGSEWWYWLKTTQNQPQMWDEAKKLFQ